MSTMKIAVGIFVITAAVHSCHVHASVASAHAGNHAAGHLGSASQSGVSSTGQSAGSNTGRVDVGNCDFAHYSICSKE